MSIFSDPTRAFVPVIKITGYEDKAQTKEKGSVTLPYDKASLDVSFENCVNSESASDGSDTSYFNKTKPSNLKVTFVLDDTTFSNPVAYLMPNNLIPDSVDTQIKQLKSLCHSLDENSQQPPYVSIKSLSMPLLDSPSGVFHGLLTEMKIKNELVDSLGNRIKAKVDCSFKHSGLTDKPAAGGTPTKMVAVLGGLSLAAVAAANFGSIASLASLAAANGLSSLRNVSLGDVVKVPSKLGDAAEAVGAAALDIAADVQDKTVAEKENALNALENAQDQVQQAEAIGDG